MLTLTRRNHLAQYFLLCTAFFLRTSLAFDLRGSISRVFSRDLQGAIDCASELKKENFLRPDEYATYIFTAATTEILRLEQFEGNAWDVSELKKNMLDQRGSYKFDRSKYFPDYNALNLRLIKNFSKHACRYHFNRPNANREVQVYCEFIDFSDIPLTLSIPLVTYTEEKKIRVINDMCEKITNNLSEVVVDLMQHYENTKLVKADLSKPIVYVDDEVVGPEEVVDPAVVADQDRAVDPEDVVPSAVVDQEEALDQGEPDAPDDGDAPQEAADRENDGVKNGNTDLGGENGSTQEQENDGSDEGSDEGSDTETQNQAMSETTDGASDGEQEDVNDGNTVVDEPDAITQDNETPDTDIDSGTDGNDTVMPDQLTDEATGDSSGGGTEDNEPVKGSEGENSEAAATVTDSSGSTNKNDLGQDQNTDEASGDVSGGNAGGSDPEDASASNPDSEAAEPKPASLDKSKDEGETKEAVVDISASVSQQNAQGDGGGNSRRAVAVSLFVIGGLAALVGILVALRRKSFFGGMRAKVAPTLASFSLGNHTDKNDKDLKVETIEIPLPENDQREFASAASFHEKVEMVLAESFDIASDQEEEHDFNPDIEQPEYTKASDVRHPAGINYSENDFDDT